MFAQQAGKMDKKWPLPYMQRLDRLEKITAQNSRAESSTESESESFRQCQVWRRGLPSMIAPMNEWRIQD